MSRFRTAELSRSPLVWIVLVAAVLGALTVAAVGDAGPRTTAERARGIAESIKCPTCQGQSVADSDATAARTIRTEIARRLEQGQTDDQIRAYVAGLYGDDALLTPPRTGVAGLIWFLPVAAMVLAVAGLTTAFRRWGARASPGIGGSARTLPGLATIGLVALVAVVAGLLVAQSSGRRGGGGLTGLDVTAASARVDDCLAGEAAASPAETDACYSAVLDELPANVPALTFRGWSRVRNGDLEGGVDDLDGALQLAPESTAARVFRASARMRAGDPVGALEDLVAFRALDPPAEEAELAAGLTDAVIESALDECIASDVSGEREPVAVAACYRNVLELRPDDATASVYLGWLLARSGADDNAALELLNAGLDTDPDLTAGYVFRAAVRAHLGDVAGAIADLETFSDFDVPDDQLLAAAQVRLKIEAGQDPLG